MKRKLEMYITIVSSRVRRSLPTSLKEDMRDDMYVCTNQLYKLLFKIVK